MTLTINTAETTRRPLAFVPTYLQFHPSLSEELAIRLFLKREDLIDDIVSGNKLRKLEYIAGHALAEGATVLVTAGSTQSNQCKAVAGVARRLGLSAHIVFCSERPSGVYGNHMLGMLFGARYTWLAPAAWADIGAHLEQIAEMERRAGHIPYVIMPGASNWLGTLGYVRMAHELAMQEQSAGIAVDHIVLPTGSGGTQAGLVVGRELLKRKWRITGIAILGTPHYFRERHASILDELNHYGLALTPEMESIDVYGGATGGGYGRYGSADIEEVHRLARQHGLILDPIYMLKAAQGLRALVRNGIVSRGETVVLVHTGGTFGLFDNNSALTGYLQSLCGRIDPCTTP